MTRAKLIEMAMEAQKRLPSNYKEALLALVASEEEKEKLENGGVSTEFKFEFVAVQGFGAMKRDYYKLSKEGVIK